MLSTKYSALATGGATDGTCHMFGISHKCGAYDALLALLELLPPVVVTHTSVIATVASKSALLCWD